MTKLIELNHIELSYNERKIVAINNLAVQHDDIIGIVGDNGSGKSTLLKLLASELPDEIYTGTPRLALSPNQIVYLEQEVERYDPPTLTCSQDSKLLHSWNQQKAYEILSGGEKVKTRLATCLSMESQLLLLDEPTNHLDEKSVDQLIISLKKYHGALIIVSHDRHFLDQLTTKIWSLEDRKVIEYRGNYTQFVEQKEHEQQRQTKLYEKQMKEINHVQREVQQLNNWSDKAHRQSTKQEFPKEFYRSKAKRMDRQKKSLEKRLATKLAKHGVDSVKVADELCYELSTSQLKNGPAFLVDNFKLSAGEELLVENIKLNLMFGDRVAIVGDNGSGKSSFLQALLYDTTIWRSQFSKIGYLSQTVFDFPKRVTIADYLDSPHHELSKSITSFVQLGFKLTQWEQPIMTLSMGERVKLKLLKFMLSEKNVLVLDEPTNHLDIKTRETLEKVLISYNGTLVVVSHDRYFRNKITDKAYSIQDKKLSDCSSEPNRQTCSEKKRLVLEFKRDELLGILSSNDQNSKVYQKANDEFIKLLKELKK